MYEYQIILVYVQLNASWSTHGEANVFTKLILRGYAI